MTGPGGWFGGGTRRGSGEGGGRGSLSPEKARVAAAHEGRDLYLGVMNSFSVSSFSLPSLCVVVVVGVVLVVGFVVFVVVVGVPKSVTL